MHRKICRRYAVVVLSRILIRIFLLAAGASVGLLLLESTRIHAQYYFHLLPSAADDLVDRPTIPSISTTGPIYRKRSEVPAAALEFNSKVQFIFTMGLEGTGHHLMGDIVQASPAMQQLTDEKFRIWPDLARRAQRLLFQDYNNTKIDKKTRSSTSTSSHHHGKPTRNLTSVGLWNAHCAPRKDAASLEERLIERLELIEETATESLERSRRRRRRRRKVKNYNQTMDDYDYDYDYDTEEEDEDDRSPLVFPINTLSTLSDYGEVSYPNFRGDCRPLNYPDLNLWYNACRKAEVDCLHVYLYRHPMEIINSVVRRGFGTMDASNMQMYIVDLRVMANQLRMYANRTLGCFGFFEAGERHSWIEALQDLWKWGDNHNEKNDDDDDDGDDDNSTRIYHDFIDQIYQRPPAHRGDGIKGKDEQLMEALQHPIYGPFVRSWWNVHNHAIDTCLQAVRS